MHKIAIRLSTVALCLSIVAASTGISAAQSRAAQLISMWNCETTGVNGQVFGEQDSVEPLGSHWLHGTARPQPGTAPAPGQPAEYDYYVGPDETGSGSVYIQVNPLEGKGTFFVGTSPASPNGLSGSQWSVNFPVAGGAYEFNETATQFTITYANLMQVCNKSAARLPSLPQPTLSCDTMRTADISSGSGYPTALSIRRLGNNWWQGVGTNSAHQVVYEYNIFTVSGEWVAVAINAFTDSYFIATSYASPNLGNTTWTVVYPRLEDGFTFANVVFKDALPQAFDLIFADGEQRCTPL